MGINNLNELQKHSIHSKYNPKTFKANTIIIDGNNLLFNRLAATRSSYTNKFPNFDLGTIDMPLIPQLILILHSTIKGIVDMINNYYYNSTKNEKNIIIVFDPPNTPNYYIPGVGLMTLKRKEEENRINAQKKQYAKTQEKIDKLKINYSDEIEYVYNQLSYLNNDSNINKLMPIIKNELLYIYHKLDSEENSTKYKSEFNFNQQPIDISNHVYLIQSISEADLVIYNLAKILNYAPILIRSMDTDYYVLCSELKNVYKRDISDNTKDKSTGKIINTPVYNIWKIWREIFDDNITYNDIITMATMAGNDYTAKSSLYGFKVDSYKRIYENNFTKITKSATHLYPYVKKGYSNIHDIMNKYCEENEDAKNSMLIYKHIDDNSEFDELKLNNIRLIDLILNIKSELNNDFYDYTTNITELNIITLDTINDYINDMINNLNNIDNQTMLAEMNINYNNINFGDVNINKNFENKDVNKDINFENKDINKDININYNNINFGDVNINEDKNFENKGININKDTNKKYENKNIFDSINYSEIIF